MKYFRALIIIVKVAFRNFPCFIRAMREDWALSIVGISESKAGTSLKRKSRENQDESKNNSFRNFMFRN